MDLNTLPKNASSLKFSKHNQHVMALCLTYRINLGLSLRKTVQALKDIHGISISHQQVANYCKTASICVKPFVDHYNYNVGKVFTADETYIKVRGIKNYIWFIMDAAKRSIIGYQVSDNRGVGPCILAMRMAFRHLKALPENFKFIADGSSAYPLAAQQFFHEYSSIGTPDAAQRTRSRSRRRYHSEKKKFRLNLFSMTGWKLFVAVNILLPKKLPFK